MRKLKRVDKSILELIKQGFLYSGKHGDLIYRIRDNKQQYYAKKGGSDA